MKRLDRPGLPEMPCICDPECMCADLCAGDLTQNCLCEENGLFCRVTEGWDIDDLDVSDLEDVEKYNFISAENSIGAQHVVAEDTSPSSPTLQVAIQLATMDRAQLLRLEKYFKHVMRPQHEQERKTSKLQDSASAVWATPSSFNARQSLVYEQHECAMKSLARSPTEVKHEFSENFVYWNTLVVVPLRRSVSSVCWYNTHVDVNGSPLVNPSRTSQQMQTYPSNAGQKTKKPGLIPRSFYSLKSALSWKFQTSKSFDGEMIDKMIRPSPFKKISHNSIA